eukprot:2409273-Alexandrium_andersonii.AAC.1
MVIKCERMCITCCSTRAFITFGNTCLSWQPMFRGRRRRPDPEQRREWGTTASSNARRSWQSMVC